MIKNDRQYRITKAKAEEFRAALEDAARDTSIDDPLIAQAMRDGIASQLHSLEFEVTEYENLRAGNVSLIKAQGLTDLPRAMIGARIARGFTQAQLADKIGLHEQQIQRWESENYANASLQALAKVADALGVETREEVFVPHRKLSRPAFLQSLTSVGISKEFLRKLAPPEVTEPLLGEASFEKFFTAAFRAANLLERFVAIPASKLLALEDLKPSLLAASTARFKVPVKANSATVHAQAVLANYIGALIVSAWIHDSGMALPKSATTIRKNLNLDVEALTLAKLVTFAWDHGVAVVPLRIAGGFHGAVWQIEKRFVVVLKQGIELEARWLFDLLHELGHIARGHVTSEDAVIEVAPIKPGEVADAEAEEEANEWAQSVLFGGEEQLAEIEEACEIASKGKLPRLKEAVQVIAGKYHVLVGVLANHLAFRLAEQGNDWWGASQNLQAGGENPFDVVRRELLRRIRLERLNPIDRDLVVRSLMED